MFPSGNKSSAHRLRSAADIGSLIKQRRKSLGLTQLEAAEQLGVGRRFLIELEEGKPTAQLGKTMHVLSMLGITLTGVAEQ
jgi:y4mF family transcriptional regulator